MTLEYLRLIKNKQPQNLLQSLRKPYMLQTPERLRIHNSKHKQQTFRNSVLYFT